MANQASCEGIAGGLVDEEEGSDGAAGSVIFNFEFACNVDAHVCDVVEAVGFWCFVVVDAVDVEDSFDGCDASADQLGAVANLDCCTWFDGAIGQANNSGVEGANGFWAVFASDEFAADEVDFLG